MSNRRRAARIAITTAAMGLAIAVLAPAAVAAPASNLGEIQTALDGCLSGTGAVTITLNANISDDGARISVPDGCEATLELDGFDLDVEGIDIGDLGADTNPGGPDAHLIVSDPATGGTLTADSSATEQSAGIRTTDGELTVSGGAVTASSGTEAAAIGGDAADDCGVDDDDSAGGTVTVTGGSVTATAGDPLANIGSGGAGIGGGNCGGGGHTTIIGGVVKATGGIFSAGIGGGASGSGGTSTVQGGEVEATGGLGGAGIGGGFAGDGGSILIDGGVVDATSRFRGAGIGGGDGGDGGTITIESGNVTAEGGGHRDADAGAGIGGGGGVYGAGDGGTILINGGTVAATGGVGLTTTGAGIGGGGTYFEAGEGGDGGNITIAGGTVVASSGFGSVPIASGAGIGGGGGAIGSGGNGSRGGHGGNITVTGGSVTATSAATGAGIGGGGAASMGGDGGVITLTGGTVSAQGGFAPSPEYTGAGIGGGGDPGSGALSGQGGAGANVQIGEEATVTALGGHTAVGSAAGNEIFGSLTVAGTLIVPEDADSDPRFLRIPNSVAGGAEVTVTETGRIVGDATPDETPDEGAQFTADILGEATQPGQIVNRGAITLVTDLVTGAATEPVTHVEDHHYEVTFDPGGGTLSGGTVSPVTVFATSFTAGERPFAAASAPPAGSASTFTGWNTQPDGSGAEIGAGDALPGSSEDGAPVEVTLYAQFADHLAPVVTNLDASPDPVTVGDDLTVTATASDADTDGSGIASAEYSLNPTGPMDAVDGAFDDVTEELTATVDTTGMNAGDYELCVDATDTAGNTSDPVCTTVVLAALPDGGGGNGSSDPQDQGLLPDTGAPWLPNLNGALALLAIGLTMIGGARVPRRSAAAEGPRHRLT